MQDKYKYIIISPYFGKLPAMFDLWAQSCGRNPQFLFLVFTDDVYKGTLPENVEIKTMSFSALQNLVQSKFDFPVSIESPYKLCDYKPALGYIFQDYLHNCKYWGHCDMDLVFGDIEKFLPQKDYDKISHLGHLCLYRNTQEINTAFKLSSPCLITYKDIFSSPVHFAFDENDDYGINAIFRKNSLSIYPFEKYVADIDSLYPNFTLSHYQDRNFTAETGSRIFVVENGRVYDYKVDLGSIKQTEYAYVHIQKRRLERKFVDMPVKYLITPSAFEPWQNISVDLINSVQKKSSFLKNLLKILSVKRVSSPRALSRKWAITKINYRNKFTRKQIL